jgi:hypothetical protein
MYIYIYRYYKSILHVDQPMCVYTYICTYVCTYIYIYTYVYIGFVVETAKNGFIGLNKIFSTFPATPLSDRYIDAYIRIYIYAYIHAEAF